MSIHKVDVVESLRDIYARFDQSRIVASEDVELLEKAVIHLVQPENVPVRRVGLCVFFFSRDGVMF